MVIGLSPYRVKVNGLSDVGLVRQNNEDVWEGVPSVGLYVLADGMGGHQAGEVAARETVSLLTRILKKKLVSMGPSASIEECKLLLSKAIIHVNASIFKMSRNNPDFKGMGTTLCCLLFRQEGLIFAHVGDSRIYRLREGELERMTKDHSLLSELIDNGQLDEWQANDFAYKNIITKAIGTEPRMEPVVDSCKVQHNDTYFMCSDGLSDLLSDAEIRIVLESSSSNREAVDQLIREANRKGGNDNITVVIAKVEEITTS